MAIEKLSEILKRVEKENLIEGLCEQTGKGVGLNLRLGKVSQWMEGYAVGFDSKGLDYRQAGWRNVADCQGARFLAECDQEDLVTSQILKPGVYYRVETVEKLNVPTDLLPDVRSTQLLVDNGLRLEVPGGIEPGYTGAIRMGLVNQNSFSVPIRLGSPICRVVFHKVEE